MLDLLVLVVGIVSVVTSIGRAEEVFRGKIGHTLRDSQPYFPPEVRAKPGSPNVVYIVLDDTGFSDLGSFGSEITTPNLDALAAGGMRYNNFHARAVCSPSRAALLTGRNSHSVGMGNLTNVVTGFPSHRGAITHAAATVAEILRSSGYNTYAVGKWHLIPPRAGSTAGPLDQWPVQRGFDRFYGFLGGMTDQFHPDLVNDNTPVAPPHRANYHLSEDLVDHAIQYIRDQTAVAPEKPFFLYLAFGATHAPHQAPVPLINKYVPIFNKGWDQTRDERLARQKQLGIVPQDTELTPRTPGVRPWNDLSPAERKVSTRLQAAFAAFLEHADMQVGRLIAFLKQAGRLDNTVVVVISDNGASREGGEEGTLNETFRIANLAHRPDSVQEQLQRIDEIGTAKTFENYPMGWAMAGNTPFKYYKHTVWGGGERDPLIICWPKGIRDKGAIRTQFVDIIDITPTILDVAGVEAPQAYHGVRQKPLEGASIARTFADSAAPHPRHVQYFELWGQRGLWHDDWKAVSVHKQGTDFDTDRWELYDLGRDFSEAHDVSRAFPEKLRELQKLWWREAKKYGVLPLDDRSVTDPSFAVGKGERRSTFTYYPGQSHIAAGSDPPVTNRSFSITAYVDRPDSGTEGVLLAAGDRFGGYLLYVKDQRLVFDFNDFGKHIVIRSSAAVPTGPSILRYEYVKSGNFIGQGTLFLNDQAVGQMVYSTTPTLTITWAGLDIGRNTLSPVSEAYADHGEFAFPAAALRKVVVRVQPPDH